MKKNFTLFKGLLVAFGLLGGVNYAWADDVVIPTPVYFNDFSFAVDGQEGLEIVGEENNKGSFATDVDPRFGKIFQNASSTSPRKNYLKLPSTVFSSFNADNKGTTMSIGFWVNAKNAGESSTYLWAPLFAAYGAAPNANNENTWPMLVCQYRGVLQVNNAGWCDYVDAQNANNTNTLYHGENDWLADDSWHYYTVVFDGENAYVYFDGVLKNQWDATKDYKNGDVDITNTTQQGLFTAGSSLTYVCLGGNQAWNYGDNDAAFGFDDFAVYNVALSAEQIAQIISNKKERNVTGTQIGEMDNSTDYLGALSDKMTLKPGDKYHYSFINYNKGDNNWNNWVLPVYDANDNRVITVRADNYEDMYHVGDTWGSNAGCTSDFNWTNFPGNMNGATVDMTVSFTADKVFNMSSTITPIDGSSWTYSYKNDYTDSPISLTNNDYISVALSVSRSWIDLLSEGYSYIGATIGSTGYTSFSSSYALDLANLPEDVYAYKASAANDGAVTLEKVTTAVPAGTGLILNGEANTTYSIPVAASATALTDNLLVGCPSGVTISEIPANHTYYVLNASEAEFLSLNEWVTSGESVDIPAGKAYLDAGTNAANLRFVFAGETTGIANMEATKAENGAMYNMAGQRVNGSYKGIVIKNGKKVYMK